MNTPTPRTDATWSMSFYPPVFSSAHTARVMRDECAALEAELAAEREKVRALRLACERIVAQWDKDHDANPISAGGRMYSWASKVLAATESENGGSNE